MAKKMRRVRTFARTATKSQEKHLIENAKKLYKNPFLILPETINDAEKYFKKTKSKIEKIHRFKDDTKKLEKFANKKGLESAFAGSLLLAESEKAPYLGVIKFPTGDITYAQRGKAEKEKLIAVQHFDDPVLRLLGVKDIAQKKGLYLYSWKEKFICTGTQAEPSKEFIAFILKKLGYPPSQNTIVCKHLNKDTVTAKKTLKHHYLHIHWQSANTTIAICEECAKNSKNTFFNITKYLLQPDIASDFEIEVIAEAVKHHDETKGYETKFLEEYMAGAIKDYDLIRKNVTHQKETLKETSEKLFVLNDVSYGSDFEKFIDALKPNNHEREALLFILQKIDEPVIVSSLTPNKLLEMYWADQGLDFIKSIVTDEKMAKSLFNLNETPSDILQMVFDYKKRQSILSELPRFESLPPLAKYADHIARTYKTFGEKNTLSEIKKRPDSPKGKSLAYAFLLNFNKGSDKKWQYSQVEVEYGEFLKQPAEKLLKSNPKQYKKALQDLLIASGSAEKIK